MITTKMGYKLRYNQNKKRKKLRRQKTHRDLRDTPLESTHENSENIWNFPSDYTSNNSENFTSGYGSTLCYPDPAEEEQLFHEEENGEAEETENIPPPGKYMTRKEED